MQDALVVSKKCGKFAAKRGIYRKIEEVKEVEEGGSGWRGLSADVAD
jgi:hypothetical protein